MLKLLNEQKVLKRVETCWAYVRSIKAKIINISSILFSNQKDLFNLIKLITASVKDTHKNFSMIHSQVGKNQIGTTRNDQNYHSELAINPCSRSLKLIYRNT